MHAPGASAHTARSAIAAGLHGGLGRGVLRVGTLPGARSGAQGALAVDAWGGAWLFGGAGRPSARGELNGTKPDF